MDLYTKSAYHLTTPHWACQVVLLACSIQNALVTAHLLVKQYMYVGLALFNPLVLICL
jgi:hypothetical protein